MSAVPQMAPLFFTQFSMFISTHLQPINSFKKWLFLETVDVWLFLSHTARQSCPIVGRKPDRNNIQNWLAFAHYAADRLECSVRLGLVKFFILTHPHPSSPILTHSHPFSPILTHPHPFSPILTHPHPSSSILTHSHPFSPILTHSHPSSPILTHPHPSSPILTHPHPSSPILTHPHPSSPILTHPHPSSPILTHSHPSPPILTHSEFFSPPIHKGSSRRSTLKFCFAGVFRLNGGRSGCFYSRNVGSFVAIQIFFYQWVTAGWEKLSVAVHWTLRLVKSSLQFTAHSTPGRSFSFNYLTPTTIHSRLNNAKSGACWRFFFSQDWRQTIGRMGTSQWGMALPISKRRWAFYVFMFCCGASVWGDWQRLAGIVVLN